MEIEEREKITLQQARRYRYKTTILKIEHRDEKFAILVFTENAIKEITDALDMTNRKWEILTKEKAIELVKNDLCINKERISVQLLYE